MLRVIMQKRRPAPRIDDQRLNSRRNQDLWDYWKTNKMAAAKPPGPPKWRYASAMRLHIENRTRTGEKPDDVRTDANKSACASGNFHLDALNCACPLEIPKSGYKSSQRSRSWLIPSENLAPYTSFLPLLESTCTCLTTWFSTSAYTSLKLIWASGAELSPIVKHRWSIHLSTETWVRHCWIITLLFSHGLLLIGF